MSLFNKKNTNEPITNSFIITDDKCFIGLNPNAPPFYPKFIHKCQEITDNEISDNEYSSEDENTQIYYDGKYYIFKQEKFKTLDEALDTQKEEEIEFDEITKMIMHL